MPRYGDGFYHQVGGKLEVWFYVVGVHEYKPPDRTILLNGFFSDHVKAVENMIDEHSKQKGESMSLSEARFHMGRKAQEILTKLKKHEANAEARDANTSLINTCGLLSACVSSLRDDNDMAIADAKAACESMLDRADRAQSNGADDLAESLRGYVAEFSPLVAALCTRPNDEGHVNDEGKLAPNEG